MEIIIGYILAGVMGLVLGLLGGGGSILTVPILVYLLAVPKEIAPSYSIFIVGVAALVGTFRYIQLKEISYRTAIVFGIPSTLAVYGTQAWILPALPDVLVRFSDSFAITKGMGLMILFAILMLVASFSMIRGPKDRETYDGEQEFNYPLIIVEGLVVGILTGLVGAGGGFMIVPALVILSKLPMKMAVGTSLLIIAGKSLIGFLGAIQAKVPIEWGLLLVFTGLAVVGILIGVYLAKYISGNKLKPAFGWFVLAMGIFVLTKTFLDG